MAATAYASLVSLLNTMDHIHAHPLFSTFFDIEKNKYLCEQVNLFVDFVEKYSNADTREVEDLVRRIADAAHEAENIVEVHAADRVRGEESPSFLTNLQMIVEKMESIKEEVIKVKEETGKSPSFLPDLPPSSSSSVPPAPEPPTILIGFDNYMHKLLDDLIGHDVHQSIISITGMSGIGKTTLARKLYEYTHVVHHFNVRAWVTVSQECSAKKVYLQALSSLRGSSIEMDTTDDRQLSDELHRTLFNRRYLIVLDDVWGVEIWDKIKFYFPENNNGSRIVVTTRESKLVDYIGSSAVVVNFLDEEYSWKLFCEKTFPQQDFPLELEEIGKKIVKKCGGLPLAITVIGGLLGKSPRTREYWEKVAKDKSMIFNQGEKNPLSILYLSYKYLPIYLKSCLVYFGSCPEDFEIQMLDLINLWVAEGLIKAKRGLSLEELAESYINDLADRNLLLLLSSTPSRKRCSIHDLVRDLCIKIGEDEKFFCVQRSVDGNHHFIVDHAEHPASSGMTSILYRVIVPRERAAPFKTRLLRVFYNNASRPYSPLQDVNMRFLLDHYSLSLWNSSKDYDYLLPSLLSRFWNLQTLIISAHKEVVAPAEIWKMSQLRHIAIEKLYLPPPAIDDDDDEEENDDVRVLENLQTLKEVQNLIFTDEVCKRIPNIKELGICCELSLQSPCYHLENLGCFNKLQCLLYYCYDVDCEGDFLHNIKFPSSLKELMLDNCKLEWSYMAVIASLPHLQHLHLENGVAGTEWVFVDERFVSLKSLSIVFCKNVTKWTAQSSNFPVLENLFIWRFERIDKIPSGIGEIPTLKQIYMRDCNESANISAVEILYEQERFENSGLQLIIQTDEAELLREKIQESGLTCQNLVIRRQ